MASFVVDGGQWTTYGAGCVTLHSSGIVILMSEINRWLMELDLMDALITNVSI